MYQRLGAPAGKWTSPSAFALAVAAAVLFFCFAAFQLQAGRPAGPLRAASDSPTPPPPPTSTAAPLTPEEEPVERLERRPLILFWDQYFADQYILFTGVNASTRPPCPYDCDYSLDRKRGQEADVRVFHQRNLDPADLPPSRADGRFVNVYYNLEPPYLSFSWIIRRTKRPVPPDFFNATATYRSHSEIFYPYDLFVPLDGSEREEDVWTEQQVEERLRAKRNASLIAMSNCGSESKRHAYVDELAAHLEVTRVGRCNGTIQCDKDAGTKMHRVDLDCMKRLIDSHHFYLAFENSVCPEYTTEKFWRVKDLIVPVVLSRAVVPRHIPPDVFVAASDFESPAALAAHLRWLIDHPAEYRKFFEWTRKYRRSSLSEAELNVSCQLCKLAHRRPQRRIADYRQEWGCRECVRDYALDLLTNAPDDLNNVRDHERRLAELMDRTYRPRALGRIL
ncbi:Alpha-(1,3)-fucosyltransferase C [Aphelenchoides fujianensis]|nr:Alpha-(1,3)-fucosyltransferase C [Aphelenchoides fujianensis]KAI6224491.1 Alpha-(1,3)-fucosyltransferase C [Aphelenchoides fujianensis]